ncbi:MAG TPA: PEP-CTERM sorting domain-containing protein [Bryobacteraceae bacterium]|nr:PEP-CTERM sorting domain-containing protein [Bryobacteraceae bacterium]
MRTLLLLMIAGLTSLHASAIVFNFTVVNVDDNISITGTLTATDIGDGEYLATTGSGIFNGDPITLIPGGPSPMISPSGLFIYDNVIYPNENPYLDVDGLLFEDIATTGPFSGAELNIWGNGVYPSVYYSTYVGLDGGYPVSDSQSTVEVTPEPGTLALLGIGFVALGAWRRRVSHCRFNKAHFWPQRKPRGVSCVENA